MRALLRAKLLALFLSATPLAAMSATVTIDFESFNLGGSTFLDTPESLTFSNVGGSGVTAQILGNDDVRIYDLIKFGGSYAAPGPQALIDMNWGNFNNPLGTDITFDQSVSNFSLIAGDFGADNDSILRIEAFDASNVSLGVVTAPWSSAANPPLQLLSLNVSGIRRVHYSSGGSFQNSTFIDNITFSADGGSVPEPGSIALAALALVGGAVARRKRAQ